jgi:glycosyltransferase involved in cell wall biosynthesis
MKILFILHFPPPVHGAAAVGLQIKESKIVNNAFTCHYINLGTSVTIDEIGVGKLIKVVRYFIIIGKVLKNVILNHPDLCYLTITSKGPSLYKDASIVFLLKLFGVKLIYHFHNKGVRKRQDKYFDNLIYRFVFKNSYVILLSGFLYPDIKKYVPEDHVYYCHNGIADREIIHVEKENTTVVEILFLSNLIESKGVYVLLEACKILQDKELDFHCTFVGGIGDISEQMFLSKLKELNLVECVNYAGIKFGIEKDRVFANSDIFILPTFNDCFPLVLLEAMQYSIPVISTFEGGIQDIVDDGVTGYIVQQKNVEELVEKLEILIKNSELRQQMGKAGRLKYETEFTSETFEQRIHEILFQVVNLV